MANPRKFSEKIALQKQKQAEGTAEFEKIMQEVYATKRDEPLSTSQQRLSDCCLSPPEQQQGGVGIPIPGSGGSNGNGGGVPKGGGNAGAAGGGGGGNGSGSPTAYRESRGRSVGVGPMRRPSDRKVDRSPYSSNVAYLSPPMDSNWRRSNSDSAIHQSLNMQPENPSYNGPQQHYLQQQQQQQQHSYHPHQRSHSPAASVGLSPTAQRRKAQHMVTQSHSSNNLQQLQLQDQLNHHKLNHNHHLHMHPHQQGAMAKSPLQFNPCAPTNSLYKSLQDQAMAMANTGSLPDLTSVHFSNAPSPSPAAITHNVRTDREQSQSPFNSQSYQQQQQTQQQQQLQQNSSGIGGLGAGQTHLSFTNLPVMVNPSSNNISANCTTIHSSYGNLSSIGGVSTNASSTGNLTEYRNPQHNPPSPAGSASPGLMVSTSPHGHSHDLHISAPNSPIRHHHQQQQQQQSQQYSDKNIQTYDRFSPGADYTNSSNNLNPSFHNHFEQFSLVDSSSAQSDPQYIPTSLQQDHHSPHNSYSQSLQFDEVLFGHHQQQQQQQFSTENGNGTGRRNNMSSLTSKLSGNVSTNNSGGSGGDPYMSMTNRNTLNNCSGNLGLSGNSSNTGGSTGGGSNNNNSSSGSTAATGTVSTSCSPLHSPHSPNPHNPSNNNSNLINDIAAISQNQQQQQPHHHHQQQHQKSHHHNNDSGGGGGGTGGVSGSGNVSNNSSNMHNSATPTTPNIPSIVFSDFSSVNPDFSKEIFDTLDLDLGQMDVAGLQMLSDPNSIMLADPTIEDSFRRDLN